MMDIQVSIQGLPSLSDALRGFEDEIPKATAQSITFTAERVQRDLAAAMTDVFQNPTPFTLNSVRKTSATPRKLWAEVKLKDEASMGRPAARYLAAQIQGGSREQKPSEFKLTMGGFIDRDQRLVPGDDAPLNAYGNISGPQMVKAMSNIGAQLDTYQNTSSAVAKRRQRRSGRQYFWMRGVGIYWREKGAGLRSFMVVVDKVDYQKRFDFHGIAESSVARHLPEQVKRSIDRVLNQKGVAQ